MYVPINYKDELNLVSDVLILDIKKIPGTIGYYASRCGKIFGTDKQDILYELKTYLNNNGYFSVTLRSTRVTDKDLINNRAMAHRLIAITFVEGYKKGLVVDHIDRNRKNNHADNLRWVTPSVNNQRTARNTYNKRMQYHAFKCYCRNIRTGEIIEFNSRSEYFSFLKLATNKSIPDRLIFKAQRGSLVNNELEVSFYKDKWDYDFISEPRRPGFCRIEIKDRNGNIVDVLFNKIELYQKYKLWNPHLQPGNNLVEKYINKFNELYKDLTISYDDTPKEDYRDILAKLPVIGTYRNLVDKEIIVMRNIETNEVATFKSARETSREIGICRKQLQEILDKNHLYKKKYLFTKETVCHRSRNTRNK